MRVLNVTICFAHTISSVMLSDLQEENTVNVEESSTINNQAMNPTNILVNTNISNNHNSNKHIIVLLHAVFHIGLVIGPKPAVLA
jgi:hypothetical protein